MLNFVLSTAKLYVMFEEMEKLIAGFPADMKDSVARNRNISAPGLKPFNKVLITGLGGSGIGGTMVAETLAGSAKRPIIVNKNYSIPSWVDAETLVVACSYSGNTEETLSATQQAVKQGAQIAVITSGGELLKMAQTGNWPIASLPQGYPPRAAFGHSSVALFALLDACGVGNWRPDELLGAAQLLEIQQEAIRDLAKGLAEQVVDRVPVIYAAEGLAGVAVRWRQQINENAKMLCWHHILPEMNHNELVGWAGGDTRMAVLMLRSSDDHPRSALRMDLSRDLIRKQTDVVIEVNAVGQNKLERMYYLIAVGDWLSLYLSKKRGVDPVEVNVITHLKNELSRH